MKPEITYTLVFFATLLVSIITTVVVARVFDNTPVLIQNLPLPFPNAYPSLPPSSSALRTSRCVAFCTNSQTGAVGPCENTALTKCVSDRDCNACTSASPTQNIKCLAPAQIEDVWPGIAEQQKALNNSADSYCLPTPESCMGEPGCSKDEDATCQLTPCQVDDDCRRCTDKLPNSTAYKCNAVTPDQTITITNTDGNTAVFSGANGQFCTPTVQGCDSRYGDATWTAEEGWTCRCRYPEVMGGPQCTDIVACDLLNVTTETSSRQQLLLNVPGLNGTKVGDVWTIDSGVDPTKCTTSDPGVIGQCGKEYPFPTAACQCDGLQTFTSSSYTYGPNPLTCDTDPCYANPNGGRTVRDNTTTGDAVNQFPPTPVDRQPNGTTCACSGYESMLWQTKITPGLAPNTQWLGRCADFTIPRTSIRIPADQDGIKNNPLCTIQINTAAQSSRLVPGLDKDKKDTCAPDPCQGTYVDPAFQTSQALGYYNATYGVCVCTQTKDQFAATRVIAESKCDRSVNPVCSICAYACAAPINETCPVRPGSNCSDRACETNPQGEKVCNCGDNCFFYNGQCISKVDHQCGCEGLEGVAGVCVNSNDKCQVVGSRKFPNCNSNDNYVHIKTICNNHSTCGESSCSALSFGTKKLEACGGSSQISFNECGLSLL